jgi:hypothetical protein
LGSAKGGFQRPQPSARFFKPKQNWMPEQLTVTQTGIPNRLVWRLVREALMRRAIADLAPPTA